MAVTIVSENIKMLRTLLDSMPESIYFKDAEGRFTLVSRSLAAFFGVDDPNKVIGKTDFDFYPHDDAAGYRRDEIAVMQTGEPLYAKEERCVGHDGRPRWYVTTKIPIRDAGNGVIGIAGMSRDVTERKHMEAELRDSEERFRRLFQSDIIGIHFWDAAGDVTEANNAYLRMIGYSHGDLAARHVRWRDLTPLQYAPIDDRALRELREGRTCAPFEKEYIRKDGQRIPVLVVATLLPHSQREGVAYALDLTDLKRAEGALRRQQREQEIILDSVPAFIWYKDRENRIIRANAAAAAARGVTKAQMEGRHTSELYPELAEVYHLDDLEVIRTGQPKMGIIEPLETESGEKRWLRTDKIPYRDESGEIIGVIVFATDITDLKTAEEALRREQRLMQLLMDHMPDAIYFKDRQSRFVRINPAQAGYIGVARPEDAIGRPDTDFFAPASAAEYFADEQEVMRTGQPLIGKIEHNGRSGEALRWFSTTKVPIREADGSIVGTAGISRDITRLKQAEEALRREQQLMQILMDNMPDAIYFKDRESRFLRTNIAHAKIMNLDSPQQAIGHTDADFFQPHDAAEFIADEHRVVETGESMIGRLEYHGGATGEMRWWSTTKVPVRDSAGDIVGIAGITRDITAIKRAEQEIRQLNEELEQRVADRTAMLEAINQQLQAEIAERRDAEGRVREYQQRLRSLASELSLAEERERRRIAVDLHDQIGQTLALIQIRLQAMRESTPAGPIARELDACVDLIRQPINDTRSLVFHLSPPVLYDLGLAAAAAWVVDQHRGRGLTITFEDDERPKPLDQTVSVLVFRAIRELVTNLVKHSGARSAKVWLRTEGESLCVGVEDDGRGFDPARGGPHSSAGGFGLFSIREQLDRAGGTMTIHSAPGKGTRIMLSVPLRPAQALREQ